MAANFKVTVRTNLAQRPVDVAPMPVVPARRSFAASPTLCTRHASRTRHEWLCRVASKSVAVVSSSRQTTQRTLKTEALEGASARISQEHRMYGMETTDLHRTAGHRLLLSTPFMRAFAATHRSLRMFVEGANLLLEGDNHETRSQGWNILKMAWSAYYSEFGDGEAASDHFTRASLAAGARISARGGDAPNCALFALGAFVGAPPLRPDDGVPAALNRALVGFIHKVDGRNRCVMTTLWSELLHDLGFDRRPHPIAGDLVVYTIRKGWQSSDEFAVHFGRLLGAEEHGLMVESKSGYAFQTFVHPLNVVDPSYFIEATSMHVHFFRARAPPLSMERLEEVAERFTARLRCEYPHRSA
jgi:hypothetical protein